MIESKQKHGYGPEYRSWEPIKRPKNMDYICFDGPNGVGKSKIIQGVQEILPEWLASLGQVYERKSSPQIFFTSEPTDTRVGGGHSYSVTFRSYLLGGFARGDIVTQAAMFCEDRRAQHEMIIRIAQMRCSNVPGFNEVNYINFPNREKSGTVVLTDRGEHSTNIFQIRGPRKKGLADAELCNRLVLEAYKTGFLMPYSLSVIILPYDLPSHNTITRLGVLDDFEGKYKEAELYADEVRDRKSAVCTDQILWIQNDPTGKKNELSLPAAISTILVVATYIYGRLLVGREYEIPYIKLAQFSDRAPSRNLYISWKELYMHKQIQSGNIELFLNMDNKMLTLKVTNKLP